jgi:DNA polymerase (family X)
VTTGLGLEPNLVSNIEVAQQFDELADRLLLDGESWFKVSAYKRAAQTLTDLEQPVQELSARGRLQSLSGVGDAIARKIDDYLETGHIPLLDRERAQQPPGQLDLMRQTCLTPRRVRALAASPLRIDSIQRLHDAFDSGELQSSRALDSEGMRTVREWAESRQPIDGSPGGGAR